MFSSGKHFEKVPTDLLKNLKFRLGILKGAQKNRDIQRGLMEICKKDILFFIRAFVWQYNPDTRSKGPFIPWDEQEKAIVGGDITLSSGENRYQYGILQCVEDREDVRWPKSREIGASWLVLMTIVWLCLFHENVKALVMSRDEDAVDRPDDPDSLFWKVRFILEHLPDWMRGEVKDKKMALKFQNGNTITGEANVVSAGVGGRATIMLIDEFGQFRNGHETYSMTSDTSNCRVFVGTHKDTSGMLYTLCFDPKFLDMREILMHWSMHPEKKKGLYRYQEQGNRVEVIDKKYEFPPNYNFVMEAKPSGGPFPFLRSVWYDKQCRRRTDRDVSMNLDIDPRGSTDRFFDSYRIQIIKAEHCTPPYWRGNLVYDKSTGQPIRLEKDSLGMLKFWISPKGECELPRMRCGAAVDVSAGSGYSPSCLSVFSDVGDKIVEYANANIYAPDFATFVVAVLRLIRDKKGTHPLLGWEIQGSAAFARRVLDELHYAPVYIKREEDALGKPRDNKGKAGWNPTPKSILTLMEEYRDALYDQRIVNRSEEAIEETLQFVYTSNSVEYRSKGRKADADSASKTHHGDIVRSDALAHKMLKEIGFDAKSDKLHVNNGPAPGTSAWREWLAEKEQFEEEEVWV